MIIDTDKVKTSKTKKSDRAERDFNELSFGEKLAVLRAEKKLKQKQIAEAISRDCERWGKSTITDRAVSKWENGDSLPDAIQFISLCRILGITDVLKTFRGIESGSDPFAGLNKLGRERANEYIAMLNENAYFSHRVREVKRIRQIPLYDLPASAGTGVFLDGDAYTMIDADATVPETATFAVRLSGDSMTPAFSDGQIVYVRQQQELQSGEIGIFLLNGEAYCKKLDTEHGIKLISLNKKYPPIKIGENAEFRVVGRVVE
ncbi:MAG: helix-turn-helix domain-containing protein [Clostridia bacterium]|nr:helix-turn-helix domain-containing protein [Clostridia bacterium]